MSQPRVCLVVTTIHEGDVLDGYSRQARAEGLDGAFRIIAIPDRRSPKALYTKCAELRASGFDVRCPSIDYQDTFLRKLGKIASLIPYDSDNRRNVGYLMALEWGCEALIVIDDDNYCIEGERVLREHAMVAGDDVSLLAAHSANGWFNVCDMLAFDPTRHIYPRGYPYHQRCQMAPLTYSAESGPLRVSAGLWLGDPDLDAITWLNSPVRAVSLEAESVLLGHKTWAPINTQNTCVHRDAIPAFYFVPMGDGVGGVSMDRFGDIFAGYFCQACVRHLGHRIRFGKPLAMHRRNAHDHFRDLIREAPCIWVLEDLTHWLPSLELDGRTYADAYLSLADALEEQVHRFKGAAWNAAVQGYFRHVAACMRDWVSACRVVTT